MAALHAACFTRPRPWSGAEFAGLLADAAVFAVTRPGGFVLGRAVLDEAELLTIAVDPALRRQGAGRALLAAFEAAAAARGASRAFLEVAADNVAALALYHGAGWAEAGRRRGYYGPGIDALVLAKPL